MPVKVSESVYRGLHAVRDSGVINMFDYPGVLYHLYDMGYYDALNWAEQNKKLYCQGIFHGFEISDSDSNIEETAIQ